VRQNQRTSSDAAARGVSSSPARISVQNNPRDLTCGLITDANVRKEIGNAEGKRKGGRNEILLPRHCSFSSVGLWSNKRGAILCCSLYVQRSAVKRVVAGGGWTRGRARKTRRNLANASRPQDKTSTLCRLHIGGEGLSVNEVAEIGAPREDGPLSPSFSLSLSLCRLGESGKVASRALHSSVVALYAAIERPELPLP